MNHPIKLAPKDSRVYNAADAPGHLRGTTMREGKLRKRSCARVYSVHHIDAQGIADCQSWDCWGGLHEERIPVAHLEPYTPASKK